MARRRFFVRELRNGQAEIAGDEAFHLTRVLRVEVGQSYEISDGSSVWLARVSEARKNRVGFELMERVDPNPPPVRLTLYAALIKFDHFETTLEKCTEVGVERIVPVLSVRTEKGLDRAVDKRRERWERILMEASQQSRRDRVPELGEAIGFSNAVAAPGDTRLFLEERPGAPPLLRALPEPERRMATDEVAMLVGPEGGWTDNERALAEKGLWTPVSLGTQILRAETAAIVACALVASAWQAG